MWPQVPALQAPPCDMQLLQAAPPRPQVATELPPWQPVLSQHPLHDPGPHGGGPSTEASTMPVPLELPLEVLDPLDPLEPELSTPSSPLGASSP
jgi:hypothetical protein